MTLRRALPPSLPTAVRVGQARAAGVSRHRLDAADLSAPFHGVRTAGDPASLVERCRALATVMDATAAFTGPTAARLWDLPLPTDARADPSLHVSSLRPARAMRRPEIVGTQRSSGQPVRRNGVPTVDPVSCWISLAGHLTHGDLVAVADRLVSGTARSPALNDPARLRDALAQARGMPGVRVLRRALDDVRVGAWSRPETHLRLLALAAGVPEPRLNEAVRLADGTFAYPDLSWPQYRVALEYDGAWHAETPAQWAADGERREKFVDAGWSSLHVRARDLYATPHALVARLTARLAARGCPLRTIDVTHLPRFTP